MNYYGKKNLVMRTKPELHCQATDGHINPFGPVDLGPHATCVAGRAGNLNIVWVGMEAAIADPAME